MSNIIKNHAKYVKETSDILDTYLTEKTADIRVNQFCLITPKFIIELHNYRYERNGGHYGN